MSEQAEEERAGSFRTWTFRGYEMGPAQFSTAMAHLYRGEVTRATTWRTRLDATTNWAVVTVAAALSFAFSSPQNPHFVLLLVFLLVLTFLYMEARRYRYYALWSQRIHLMEIGFFAPMLGASPPPSVDWADSLADSLLHPVFPVARWEAIGRRFRRNYVWLISLLLASWGAKLALHPSLASEGAAIVARAAIGPLPGAWVVGFVGAVYGLLVGMMLLVSLPRRWREELQRALPEAVRRMRRAAGPLVVEPPPRERLATIITGQGRQVAIRLLGELGRGVTALTGTGMYTGQARDVLLCAVTDVQVSHLERIVGQVDPEAFVIISPAEEVRGKGFRPFEPPS